jgi:glycosyltransferase involved in cell wall biosynthesis
MRIAVYLPERSASAAGGFTFQDDIVAALRRVATSGEHSYVLVSPAPPAGWAEFDRQVFSFVRGPSDRRIKLRRSLTTFWPSLELLQRGLGLPTALDRRLKGLGVDFVWFATPYCCETELPYIFTIWDLQHRLQPWFPEVSQRGRWEFREHWYLRAVQRASLVIVPNSAGRQEVERFYGLLPERVIELAHPTPSFALRAATESPPMDVAVKFGLAPDYFFYPAQFWPHKNHVLLLRALAQLKRDRDLRPQLVLVGPDRGNLDHVRQQARALGVEDQVHFLGFVERSDLVNLYRQARGMVYPSYFGPENLPPLEAFAFGCPVIAARVSGAEQQLGAAARLVDPTDPAEMAAAMFELLRDDALRDGFIERGRERARRWKADDYVRELLRDMRRLEAARACWGGEFPPRKP